MNMFIFSFCNLDTHDVVSWTLSLANGCNKGLEPNHWAARNQQKSSTAIKVLLCCLSMLHCSWQPFPVPPLCDNHENHASQTSVHSQLNTADRNVLQTIGVGNVDHQRIEPGKLPSEVPRGALEWVPEMILWTLRTSMDFPHPHSEKAFE